jgi:hypothetical protein
MGRVGQDHVTACAGSTGPLALVRQLHREGWTALSRVLVTRPGPEWAAAGACGPRVKGAGWSHVSHGPGPGKENHPLEVRIDPGEPRERRSWVRGL